MSATRCCAKAIIDVAAVKFRFGGVTFVEKLQPRSQGLFPGLGVGREASKRVGARLFISALARKVFKSLEPFMVGDNFVQRGFIHSENEFVFVRKIEIAKSFTSA